MLSNSSAESSPFLVVWAIPNPMWHVEHYFFYLFCQIASKRRQITNTENSEQSDWSVEFETHQQRNENEKKQFINLWLNNDPKDHFKHGFFQKTPIWETTEALREGAMASTEAQ